MKPRILIIADVPNWAWARKAEQLQKHLSDEFAIDVMYSTQESPRWGYDLIHTFEFNQMGMLTPQHGRAVTGITAHVWRTWEMKLAPGIVNTWASKAVAVHANSKLLQEEIGLHLQRPIHYVPNGVDETFFTRTEPRKTGHLVVGWVGKPNPRKGRHIVEAACTRAGVEFRPIERNSSTALGPAEMRAFYQDIHVIGVASDMDGTPNPALEAAACGCAVISNRIGNMPEFVEDGANGFLVERDVDAFAAALAKLDVRRAIEMGHAARATVERGWTWKIQSQNYAELWRAALTART